MENRQQNRKRTGLLVALALCCVLAVGGGVMAWFSARDEVGNVFTSGDGITDPEVQPKPDPNPDPDKPVNPDPDPNKPVDEDKEHLNGKIIETKWVPNSAITADSVISKNPNVGIGLNSKPAFVFVEIENKLGEGSYFILNKGWLPVIATQYEGAEGWASAHGDGTAVKDAAYSSGLFVYVGESKESEVENAMTLLTPKEVESTGKGGAYTGEVFSEVYTGGKFNISAEKKIDVKAYLVAESSAEEFIGADAVKKRKEIVGAAKAWMTSNNSK